MRLFILLIFCLFISPIFFAYGESELPGKHLFYNSKSKYGSCNYCHKDGGSAGRFDVSRGVITTPEDEGKKIPSLKGVSKRKNHEQIVKTINYMKKMFTFELSEKDIEELADYVSTL